MNNNLIDDIILRSQTFNCCDFTHHPNQLTSYKLAEAGFILGESNSIKCDVCGTSRPMTVLDDMNLLQAHDPMCGFALQYHQRDNLLSHPYVISLMDIGYSFDVIEKILQKYPKLLNEQDVNPLYKQCVIYTKPLDLVFNQLQTSEPSIQRMDDIKLLKTQHTTPNKIVGHQMKRRLRDHELVFEKQNKLRLNELRQQKQHISKLEDVVRGQQCHLQLLKQQISKLDTIVHEQHLQLEHYKQILEYQSCQRVEPLPGSRILHSDPSKVDFTSAFFNNEDKKVRNEKRLISNSNDNQERPLMAAREQPFNNERPLIPESELGMHPSLTSLYDQTERWIRQQKVKNEEHRVALENEKRVAKDEEKRVALETEVKQKSALWKQPLKFEYRVDPEGCESALKRSHPRPENTNPFKGIDPSNLPTPPKKAKMSPINDFQGFKPFDKSTDKSTDKLQPQGFSTDFIPRENIFEPIDPPRYGEAKTEIEEG